MGVVANPTAVSQFCFSGTDYTAVVVTARFESFSDTLDNIRHKNSNDSFSVTHVRHVRH